MSLSLPSYDLICTERMRFVVLPGISTSVCTVHPDPNDQLAQFILPGSSSEYMTTASPLAPTQPAPAKNEPESIPMT